MTLEKNSVVLPLNVKRPLSIDEFQKNLEILNESVNEIIDLHPVVDDLNAKVSALQTDLSAANDKITDLEKRVKTLEDNNNS